MKYQEARVVFIGDAHVGKSSLINGIISYSFTEEVMHVFPVVTIPAGATAYNIVLHIVDTGVDDEHKEEMETEIKKADVLVMIYSVDSVDSIANIYNRWLPLARELLGDRAKGVPVLLVGNKADLKPNVQIVLLKQQEEIANKIMRDFQEVEVWLDCSAKTMMNTPDLLFYAQKSSVCPLRAIFDSAKGQLTDPCKVAFQRIFRLCDKDGDGILSDSELNAFQEECFGGSLQPEELKSVKSMVSGRCPQGITSEGLNVTGFQFLQTIFIHDSQPEMPWTVLRKYGYGLDLQLTEEFLNPVVHVSAEQSAELSSSGLQFFTTLFNRFDRDKDSALNSVELENLFATTPGIPWGKSFSENTITDFNGNVTLRGFLALWNMTTLLDYATTLRYLACLGCESPKEALVFPHKTANQKANKSSSITDVLLCYVFGASGTGKTALLKSFIEKPFYDVHIPTTVPYAVANSVAVNNTEKYLALLEVPFSGDSSPLDDKVEMAKCDVVMLMYDSLSTSSQVQPVFQRLLSEFPSTPCVIVHSKSDLPESKSQASTYTTKRKNIVHTSVSTKTGRPTKLFEEVVIVAVGQQEKNVAMTGLWKRRVGVGITLTVLVGGLFLAGRFLWKTMKK